MPETARILFVDDDVKVLRGLRRSMQDMADHWDMVFCESGTAALAELERNPADVVVSDMRMPQMDGASLLDTVRRRHPSTVRVILSGFAEIDAVMKTVSVAHIYLAKPCQPDQLRNAIARPLGLRRRLSEATLRDSVGEIANLPTLSDLFRQIDAELRSGTGSAASVAELLSKDVAMTAEILKLTNSAFFGLGARITSVLQAVRTLGLETIRTLVLQVGLFRYFIDSPDAGPQIEALNRYGIALGHLAEMLARDMGLEDDLVQAARCAGMLSPIGCLVLLDRRPEKCRDVIDGVCRGVSLFKAEEEAFGTSHHMVGAFLLGLWGFRDDLVDAVAYADCPSTAQETNNAILTAVHAATALGPRHPLLPSGLDLPAQLDMAYLVEVRQDKNLKRWRELASRQRGEG